MPNRKAVRLDLKALERQLKANQTFPPLSDRGGRRPARAPRTEREDSRQAGRPRIVNERTTREQARGVLRGINRKIAVGFRAGHKHPATFWHDGVLHVVREVLDVLPLAAGRVKYRVRTDDGVFLIVRLEDGWVLESQWLPATLPAEQTTDTEGSGPAASSR